MKLTQEENSSFDYFVETWTKQLARSIQVFSGIEPAVTWTRVKNLPPGESERVFWWKQGLQGSAKFTMWIGADESTWNAIGRASDDANSEDSKAAYLEIIAQTQQATASSLSSALPEHLQCRRGQVGSGPKSDSLVYALIGVTISGEQLPALMLVAEKAILEVLATAEELWGDDHLG